MIERAKDLRPGDLYIVNDPYLGGTHLMDVRFVEAVLLPKASCSAWLANTGHWPDTGGAVPGGFSANATEVEQEGLRLPPVKLYKEGVMDEEILSIILSNIRVADQRIGDIKAQAAALSSRRENASPIAARPLRARRSIEDSASTSCAKRAAQQMRAKIAHHPRRRLPRRGLRRLRRRGQRAAAHRHEAWTKKGLRPPRSTCPAPARRAAGR